MELFDGMPDEFIFNFDRYLYLGIFYILRPTWDDAGELKFRSHSNYRPKTSKK
ncbi:hypothetical protein GCM10022209_42630 [Chitinophaga oryziterrae]